MPMPLDADRCCCCCRAWGGAVTLWVTLWGAGLGDGKDRRWKARHLSTHTTCSPRSAVAKPAKSLPRLWFRAGAPPRAAPAFLLAHLLPPAAASARAPPASSPPSAASADKSLSLPACHHFFRGGGSGVQMHEAIRDFV